jgi:hypothetical protein
MRLAAISNEIKDNQKAIDNLRMNMQEILHQEFLYLFGKEIQNTALIMRYFMVSDAFYWQ